jgi:hypothetical protein
LESEDEAVHLHLNATASTSSICSSH